MTYDVTLQTAALPGAADDTATPPPGDEAAAIDPRGVTQLTMYLREGLHLVDLADGRRRQIARDDWHALAQTIECHPDSRLLPVTAGRYDVIWRVEWTTREED